MWVPTVRQEVGSSASGHRFYSAGASGGDPEQIIEQTNLTLISESSDGYEPA